MDKISREEMQKYVDDYWLIFSEEEKRLAISEGFHPPRSEVIEVDFVTGLGEVARHIKEG